VKSRQPQRRSCLCTEGTPDSKGFLAGFMFPNCLSSLIQTGCVRRWDDSASSHGPRGWGRQRPARGYVFTEVGWELLCSCHACH